jgi:phage tail tape-measure protein
MSSLMGMNRFYQSEAVRGLTQAAGMQGQRESTKTQLEAAHDATVKGTTASMAGSGAIIGGMTAMAGAEEGATFGSAGGPAGMAIGVVIGGLAGWLMSEFS